MGVCDGKKVRIGNERGEVVLVAKVVDTARPGVVVAEGVWPDNSFEGNIGINVLVDATPVAPAGGAAFHDTAIWMRPE